MRGFWLYFPIEYHIVINSCKEGLAYLIAFVVAIIIVFILTKDHQFRKK